MAVHTLFVTATYGYTLYRERFAQELKVDVSQLDARVSALIHDRLLMALRPPGDDRVTPVTGVTADDNGTARDEVSA